MSDTEIAELRQRLDEAHELIGKLGRWVMAVDKASNGLANFCTSQKKTNANLYECLSGVSKKADAIAQEQAKTKAKAKVKPAPKPEVRTSAHEFFDLRLISDPANVVAKCDLYATYHEWCRDRGLSHVDKVAFGMAILGSVPGCTVTRLSRDGDRLQAYKGIRVLPQDTTTSSDASLPPRLSDEAIVAEFARDRCKVSPSAVIRKSKVYSAFQEWRIQYGHPNVLPREFYPLFVKTTEYAAEILTGNSPWKSHSYKNVGLNP